MNPAYLHQPITTRQQVEKILKSNAVEDQHHDWKADWWSGDDGETPAEEAAKDVSAFLNADGGTILVGIDEDNQSRASQPFHRPARGEVPERRFKLGKRQKQLQDWLHERLEPSEARTYVSYQPLKVDWKGTKWDVLAVNVAPYPHGAVAAVYRQSKDLYRFVIREGEHAREMAWEEVVRRNGAGNRAMYLRLKAMTRTTGRIVVSSPVEFRLGRETHVTNARQDNSHGFEIRVAPDVLRVRLDCHTAIRDELLAMVDQAAQREVNSALRTLFEGGDSSDAAHSGLRFLSGNAAGQRIRAMFNHPHRDVSIPLDAITSAWVDESNPNNLNVAMRCSLRWENQQWSLRFP